MRTALVILVFVTLAPLFRPGLYTSPDGENHLVRIGYFYKYLSSGNLAPKWIDELNHGQGYPIFFFIYPLPYYLTSIWRLLGSSIVDSLKLTLMAASLFGAFGVYFWIHKLYKDPRVSFSAGVLYLFTPYRFIDMYVRLAFGEVIALSIIPFCLLSLETANLFFLAISLSLLLLSHAQLFLIFIPVLVLYSIFRKKLKLFISGIILSLGLSAFFWLPASTLISHTQFADIHQFVPSQHLPTLGQLVYSKWGFGFSHPGPNDQMSFQFGLANWAILLYATYVSRKAGQRLMTMSILFLWISLLVMSSNPLGIWDLPALGFIQFPWRLLSLTPILIPLAIISLPKKILPLVLVFAIFANRNHIAINLPQFVNTPDSYFLSNPGTTTSTPNEFMPKANFQNHPILTISYTISLVSLVSLLIIWPKYQSA